MQPDSVGMGNRFAYVGNNPIILSAPSGKVTCRKILSPRVHSEDDCGDDALSYNGEARAGVGVVWEARKPVMDKMRVKRRDRSSTSTMVFAFAMILRFVLLGPKNGSRSGKNKILGSLPRQFIIINYDVFRDLIP